jgi:hypothetical protein
VIYAVNESREGKFAVRMTPPNQDQTQNMKPGRETADRHFGVLPGEKKAAFSCRFLRFHTKAGKASLFFQILNLPLKIRLESTNTSLDTRKIHWNHFFMLVVST